MREVTRDEKFPNEPREETTGETFSGEVLQTSPSETELVQVALLMRLYDLGMAILTSMDEDKANQVFEAHEKGEHFNPPIFIPTPESTEQ